MNEIFEFRIKMSYNTYFSINMNKCKNNKKKKKIFFFYQV